MTALKLAAASKPCCCYKICGSALMGMDSLSPPIEMNAVAISVFLLCASVQFQFFTVCQRAVSVSICFALHSLLDHTFLFPFFSFFIIGRPSIIVHSEDCLVVSIIRFGFQLHVNLLTCKNSGRNVSQKSLSQSADD